MADKSTAFLIGVCEDVPVVVANTTILTDFVILDIPEDDAMAFILGRPFLNTAGAVIDCDKGNVTFHVNVMSTPCTFRRNDIQYIASILSKRLHRFSLGALNALFLVSR